MAKTCYKPQNTKEYGSKIYNEKDYGHQIVVIPSSLMKDIMDYKEISRDIDNLSIKKYI